MKILSLNIFDLPLWFVKDRKQRLDAIKRYLRDLNVDIICLQESFDPKHRLNLNDFFKANGYYASDTLVEQRRVLGVSMDTTGGLAIFSKFPIFSRAFIAFDFIPFAPQESAGKKGALVADVQTPRGKLRIVNTHLCQWSLLFEKRTRLNQMKRILDAIAKRIPLPTVIAGDFNEKDIFKNKHFGALMDAHRFVHPATDAFHPTYRKENPYVNIWMNRISHSKRIDYIMYNDLSDLALEHKEYSVLYPDRALSDHDPVVLTLHKA
ncbi:MAG: endonuclease/exonuclease/phosphatase family protein [bacterium]|nr:endonuclease/exonuclease/phosphatase family protein [bacterium]